MRLKAITASLVMTMALLPATAAKDESLPQLIAHAESARPEERPQLYTEIAERELHNADQLYTDGKVDEARSAVTDVVNYSQKATDAASQTGKKLKNTEIAVRKMAEKLRDIKRSLAFEDQAPVQAAIERLEAMRTNLLDRMFGKGVK
ncbi:MAG TPA: hypothetical protein VKB77_09470 [Terriglobales bacterium]|nr:hypothetical protein [Terriglobales bacterium]